ncbi:N-formylglutamate amidohydrolase [Stakelama flava]|uniref:N-formylglutamate amidohydrolase n=1 Tax=Stakelama flava TaxID=2860338 RepID=UPI0031BAC0F2
MNGDNAPSYHIHGPAIPVCPVILSVPHAGRAYPGALLDALNVPLAALLPLEDRLIDEVTLSARRHETLLIARRPRAWIDLNRAEWERDPQVEADVSAQGRPRSSAKLRAGLGLVPRRSSGFDHIWNRRFTNQEIDERIGIDHRPYHAALEELLRAARARFGIAVLLDIHSMPGLPGADPPDIVIGDRFGRSATGRLSSAAEAAATQSGMRVATNSPYAGGHILDTHGRPERGIHAIQIEIDRTRYLDGAMEWLNEEAGEVAAMLRRVIDALAEAAIPGAVAAE